MIAKLLAMVRIAIVTFEGCNEIDSFVALDMLGRVQRPDWHVDCALAMLAPFMPMERHAFA